MKKNTIKEQRTPKKVLINENQLNLVVNLLLENERENRLTKKYTKLKREEIQKLMEADPSESKKFSDWLCRLYNEADNKRRFLEDLYKATEYLTLFKENIPAIKRDARDKARGEGLSAEGVQEAMAKAANIDSYPSLDRLFQVVEKFRIPEDLTEDDERNFIYNRYYFETGKARKIYEDSKWLVIGLLDYEASKYYAEGTEWCTRYPDQYNSYSSRGVLMPVFDKEKLNTKDPMRRLQFHVESDSYMDNDDSPIGLGAFLRANPALENLFIPMIVKGGKISLLFREGYSEKVLDMLSPDDLKNLNIDGLNQTSIPASIGRFTKLDRLSCQNNQINTLPDTLANCQELDTVNISKNKFTSIPKVLHKIEGLRYLMALGNQIRDLSPQDEQFLRNITFANLKNNPLSDKAKAILESINNDEENGGSEYIQYDR